MPLLRRAQPFIAIAALFLTFGAWAFASPVGSSPDEDHHLVSIWCASGDYAGSCESTSEPTKRLVSPGLLYASCFSQHNETSAECQTRTRVFDQSTLIETSRGNFFGGYPGGYFSVMRVFASPDIQASVIVMRLLNAALFCAVLTVIAVSARRRIRTIALAGTALTLVPLGLFTIASINPSSWAFSAIVAVFFGTFEAFHVRGWRRASLITLAAVGLAMAASARYDGLVYAVVAAAVAVLLARSFTLGRRARIIAVSALGLGVIGAAVVGPPVLRFLASTAGNSGIEGTAPLSVFFYNVAALPTLFAGLTGGNGLGWLDTRMPFATWMVAAAILWGVLFSMIRHLGPKALAAALGVAGLMIAVPLTVLQLNNAVVGQNVQARYIFPLLLLLVFVTLVGSTRRSLKLSTTQRVMIVVGLSLAQALAIVFNMARYIWGGTFPKSINLNSAPTTGWWWPLAPAPFTVLAVAALGFLVFLVLSFATPGRAARGLVATHE